MYKKLIEHNFAVDDIKPIIRNLLRRVTIEVLPLDDVKSEAEEMFIEWCCGDIKVYDKAKELYWNDQISGTDIYNRSAYNSRQTMLNSTYLCVQV